MTDWDDAFDNANYVPDALGYFDLWQERAQAFRNSGVKAELSLPYGQKPRQELDIFYPEAKPKGLVVFIHGGYWLRLDHRYFSDLATGPLAHGWAVALPSYTLAPQARISQMTSEIATAVSYAANKVDGPIRIAGHSAGGHLAARMVCKSSPLSTAVQKRIIKTVSISGLHDLRNLCKTKLNETLNLTKAEAISESPYLDTPVAGTNITCWVGGAERPEFIKQSHLLHNSWQSHDAKINVQLDGTENHYTVINGLKDPYSGLTKALLD
ncbi:MAG: alpha/beta hydrolase [Proteobacteria bacterium]|nr:alpha/beta hydrolase [Pseudomonadota bacterium]